MLLHCMYLFISINLVIPFFFSACTKSRARGRGTEKHRLRFLESPGRKHSAVSARRGCLPYVSTCS
jgi:hypothetical protein